MNGLQSNLLRIGFLTPFKRRLKTGFQWKKPYFWTNIFPCTKVQRTNQKRLATSTVKYVGELRTECTHLASGTIIHTDAPIDNKGKGESFSPSDLLATSYASCMLTIIGIFCQEHGYSFQFGSATVTKIMEASPRRIGKLSIELDLRGNGWNNETLEKIKRAALACPVAKSVHESMEIDLQFTTDVSL